MKPSTYPKSLLIAALLFFTSSNSLAQDSASAGTVVKMDAALDALVPTNYRIEKLAGGFAFTEGPVWHSGPGHLMFSDLRSNAIHIWDPEDGLSTFIQPVFEGESETTSVGSNGLNIDPQGRLLLCEHGNRRISRRERDGSITVLADNYQGRRLNSPNDSAYKSDGWLYFTDPPYGLAGLEDDPARELDFNGIYRLSPDGELELLESNQTRPNGIAFSPDERTLYVANSDAENKVWMAYDVLDDGTMGEGRVFYDVNDQNETGAADGMKVDVNGNVFATGPGGVWIFDPSGKHLGTIKPDEVPANVAWGDDGSTLYMTARTGLYKIELSTRGKIP
ncbi:MAG: SMP-30/gluconolactonase/LRE family protein [Gammaproteobacteria bacterium]|jgi:gluconolactonase|nr:SMP-30/gluconolactonase/LRE family protein [Gammaproteobacteria bacterium]MDP7455034.1 SMP-30/gluconolactonase/LRE family protein [Gammaproteobacteria bacterium]HJO12900.1 SMP-30/gluconolactonase/LRE family protein [Gammaproteobacteria bacterium]|tara:strand:+ start:4294 stop:5298 length:1005 start_codon:yes stop_codon:yes gene_type:complete